MQGGEDCNFVTGLDLVSDDRAVNNSELPHPSAPGYECGDFLDVIIDEKILSKRALKARTDPEYREKERIKNLERTRKLRMDPAFRDKERIKNRISKQRARLDPCYREAERVRNRIQKRKAREDPAYREAERVRNMWQKRRAREDPMFRMKERIKNLERKQVKRWSYSQCDDEWMEIGAVNLDDEARVAFEHGLYRVVTNNEGCSWEGSEVLIKTEPETSLWDSYFDDQIDQGGDSEANLNLYTNTSDGNPTDHPVLKSAGTWAPSETLGSNNELDGNRGNSVIRNPVLESAKQTNLKKQIPSPLLTHALSSPPLSCQDNCHDKVEHKVNELNDKNKLKINLNDIEILPLSHKREDKYPNLNWQIEVLRVDKVDKNDKDYKSFHTSSQTIDYNKKFAKQYPTIQV